MQDFLEAYCSELRDPRSLRNQCHPLNISSLPADDRRINEIARKHWGIENKLHWRLDVSFNEDKACITHDNAAENLSIIRKWALNILTKAKTKQDQTIKSLVGKNAMSISHLKNTVNTVLRA